MLFSDVIGQDLIKSRLIKTVEDNRISHAQLFVGPEGSGTLPMALAFAQYISCENKEATDSCNKCSSCIKYNKFSHPDLHFIYPVNSTKDVQKATSAKFSESWRKQLQANPYMSLPQWYGAIGIENKQGIINKLDCDEVIKSLSLMAYEAEYKIMIIWRPERLFHAVAPKLLKILEEPPKKTLFLLVSENKEGIIKTIVSRTQIVSFKQIDRDSLGEAIEKKYTIESEKAKEVSRLSMGNYTEAVRIMEKSENREFYAEKFKLWMRLCYMKDVIKLMSWVNDMSKIGRERQKGFMSHVLDMIRASLLINYRHSEGLRVMGKDREFAANFSPFVHAGNCREMICEFNTSYYGIERNGNAKILLLDLSLKMVQLLRKKEPQHLEMETINSDNV